MVSTGWGQDPLRTDTAAPYQRIAVVELDTALSQEEIYRRAKRWFVDSFRDAKEVIQLDDPTTFTVVGKGVWKFNAEIFVGSAVRKGYMRFSLEIAAKEGRYRVRFYDYRHEGSTSATQYGLAGPLNLGLIYDDKSYCTRAYNTKDRASYIPSKHEERVCLEEVWPQIEEQERAMLVSLFQTMSVVTPPGQQLDKRSTPDW